MGCGDGAGLGTLNLASFEEAGEVSSPYKTYGHGNHLRDKILDGCFQWLTLERFQKLFNVWRIARGGVRRWHLEEVWSSGGMEYRGVMEGRGYSRGRESDSWVKGCGKFDVTDGECDIDRYALYTDMNVVED